VRNLYFRGLLMKNSLVFLLVILIFSSCSIFDREEDLPSYILINEFDFIPIEADPEPTTNISEVRVTVNGNSAGIFAPPAVVPILAEGSADLILTAVIKQNGISSSRVNYPLYSNFRVTETLVPLDTLEINPSITYLETVEDPWLETFENSVGFTADDSSQGTMEAISDESVVVYGDKCAFFEFPNDANYFYAETDEAFNLPVGQAVFLEFDYSCNHPFTVGILRRIGEAEFSSSLVGMNSTTEGTEAKWNKIYVNLTDFIAANSNSTSFELYYEMNRISGSEEPLIYLDNVKVIY